MKLTKRVYVFLDKLIDLLAGVTGVIVLFFTLLVCADVAMRSILNHPIEHVTEITGHGLLFVTFLSAAWVLKKEGHVHVDIVFNQLSPRGKDYCNILNAMLGAIVCLMLTGLGTLATCMAFQKGTVFATSRLSLPRGPILAAIPIGGFLLFVEFLAQSFRNLNKWKSERNKGIGKTEK